MSDVHEPPDGAAGGPPPNVNLRRRVSAPSPRERPRPPHAVSAESLLAGYPPPVRILAERLRDIVRATIPDAEERVQPGWRALGYHDPHAGYFCGIFPQHGCVRIYFERGRWLADPDGLLEGDGRRTRMMVIRTARDIRAPALRRLLRRAVMHGSVRGA